jgi:Fe-S oxidoreductase
MREGLPGGRGEVGLFVTCLVDLMRPSIAFAALRLIEAAGYKAVVPTGPDLLRAARLQCR